VRWAVILGKALSILLEGRASEANPQFAASRLSVPLSLTGTLTKPTLRAASSPPSDRACRTPQGTTRKPEQVIRELAAAFPDRTSFTCLIIVRDQRVTHYRATATAEISILASRGKRATSTVARAGGALLKYVT